jgi:lysozyme
MTPKEFQDLLHSRGFDAGRIDGYWGPRTEEAVEAWFRTGWDLDDPREVVQTMSQDGIEFLMGWEGCKLSAYQDSAGVWTIGYGHTSAAGPPKVTAGMKITQTEAVDILKRDLAKFEDDVRDEMGNIPQEIFDCGVSFHYNTGGIAAASWPDYWARGEVIASEQKLKAWNKVNGRVNKGLVRRRAAEADMGFRGDYTGRP